MQVNIKVFVHWCSLVSLIVGASFVNTMAQTNDQISDQAVTYVGENGGQCKSFLRTVLSDLSSGIGAGYRQAFLDRGVEVNSSNVIRGDIMQIYSPNAEDNQYLFGYHTAIVLTNNGDGTFQFGTKKVSGTVFN